MAKFISKLLVVVPRIYCTVQASYAWGRLAPEYEAANSVAGRV